MGWKFESKNRRLQNIRKFPIKGFPKFLVHYRPRAVHIRTAHNLKESFDRR
jgi:hypothetical protein